MTSTARSFADTGLLSVADVSCEMSHAVTRTRVLSLYRGILKHHRDHMPPALRHLGDEYVRKEFQLAKSVPFVVCLPWPCPLAACGCSAIITFCLHLALVGCHGSGSLTLFPCDE